jgi:hypothetical protein
MGGSEAWILCGRRRAEQLICAADAMSPADRRHVARRPAGLLPIL